MKVGFLYLIFLIVLTITGCSSNSDYIDGTINKEESSEQFENDGNYDTPELNVDGIADDETWKTAPKIEFGLLKNDKYQASAKFYRGEKALYVFFSVLDNNLLVKGNNNGDDVTKSDSIEFYIDTKNNGTNKPDNNDFQINVAIHGKTRILVANGGSWGSWNGLLDFAVNVNGTINDTSDTDTGYDIELMIPYAQTNMSKNDTFGFSLGHVEKFDEKPNDCIWSPVIFNGVFIDPQNPAGYIILQGNDFFNRGQENKENINIIGVVTNQNNEVVCDVLVGLKDSDNVIKTNELGEYELININPNIDQTLVFSKDGITTVEKELSSTILRHAVETYTLDMTLFDTSIRTKTTFKGQISNVAIGSVSNANVIIDDFSTKTDESGYFEIIAEILSTSKIIVSKEGYLQTELSINLSNIIINGETDLGIISLNNQCSTVEFGGNRGINLVKMDIGRTLEGINLVFKSNTAMPSAGHIELFIDTLKSSASRDTTDYRIDFAPNKPIVIINFGDGSNTSESELVMKTISYKSDLHLEVYIPYSFFGISNNEIIGFSAGVWSGSDWDGFGYLDQFIAPELPTNYVRLGLDNQLYCYVSNDKTVKMSGELNGLEDVFVNDVLFSGEYQILITYNKDQVITFKKDGYETKKVNITKEQSSINFTLDIVLETKKINISGNTLAGVKIYIEGNEDDYVISDEDGNYNLGYFEVTQDLTIIADLTGYLTYKKTYTAYDLENDIVLDIEMVEGGVEYSLIGVINSIYGVLANASVSIGGQTDTTNSNGEYVIGNIPANQFEITVTLAGYEKIIHTVTAAEQSRGILNLNLHKPSDVYEKIGNLKNPTDLKVVRTVEGILFTFNTQNVFNAGNFEVYIDTKESEANREDSNTNYRFDLFSNGTVNVINFGGGTNTSNATIKVTKVNDHMTTMLIPYTFLGVTNTEVIGYSFGLVLNGWDGWGHNGFIAPEHPIGYIRLSADNKAYKSNNNN